MAEMMEARQARVVDNLKNDHKYLTFALGDEEYGVEILKVREIIGYVEVIAVPRTPHCVKGVINLRGQVIPVVDLRAKFGMQTTDVTDETCIIVVEVGCDGRKFNTGIVVDRVQEVLDIPRGNIEESPQFGASVNMDFILGMAKVAESVKILLDIDRVLTGGGLGNVAAGQLDAPAPEWMADPEREHGDGMSRITGDAGAHLHVSGRPA